MGKTLQALLPMLAVFSAIVACSTPSQERILQRNRNLVQRMNREVWNEGNLDVIDELYSAGFVQHFLPDGSQSMGIDDLRARVQAHRKAFPDWSEEIKQTLADADLVVIRFVSTGTNEGSWLGHPATGNSIRINEMSIFRIQDGKIAEQWLLPDVFSLRRQLGLDAS